MKFFRSACYLSIILISFALVIVSSVFIEKLGVKDALSNGTWILYFSGIIAMVKVHSSKPNSLLFIIFGISLIYIPASLFFSSHTDIHGAFYVLSLQIFAYAASYYIAAMRRTAAKS
ncbi:MAG: hypothetical protein HQL32_17250 [Planctomycetes bacterium]|nr:hypothetical protein [Planctomycetota bacterium]